MSEKSNKTVQEKLSELAELVAWFQGDSFKLEESLEKYKAAEALAEDVEKELNKLKNDVQVIAKKFDAPSE
jgi:exodeoxyribonuclease VII small subunit